jgi:hypothetical protein
MPWTSRRQDDLEGRTVDTATRPEPAEPDEDGQGGGSEERVDFRAAMVESIGGPRGIVDSALPTIAFVIVESTVNLTSGIVAAVVVGIAIFVLRLTRGEPKQQAFSGLLAVGVAAFFASRTKSSRGYFLPSILKNAAMIVIGLASVALRRPLAGYVMAGFDQRYAGWRDSRATMRAADWATGIWIIVYVLRFGVQGALYLAGRSGWLAVANIALGLPLFGLAVLATLVTVRRLAPVAGTTPPVQGPTDAAEASQPEPTEVQAADD